MTVADESRTAELQRLVEARDWPALERAVQGETPQELADLLLEMPITDRVLTFWTLTRHRAAEVFSHLHLEAQHQLLEEMTDGQTRALLAALPPDDRTHLLAELPAEVTRRALALLSPDKRRQAQELLGYPARAWAA
jgi:magnesium transporter